MTGSGPTIRPVAVVAATEMELAPLRGLLAEVDAFPLEGTDGAWHGRLAGRPVVLAASGVGTAAAATTVATLAARVDPAAVIVTGIAGAYVGAFVPVGAAVAAASEYDLDAGIVATAGQASLATIPLARGSGPDGPIYESVATDDGWRSALARASGTVALPFATSDAISGDLDVAAERAARSGAAIESMEGVGAALACARLGIPFGELRGVSNVAGVRDKAAWDVPAALRAATRALRIALAEGPDPEPTGPRT
jgi:futalosine hydrolase